MAWWLLSTALADIPAQARWVGSDGLAVGVAADASFINQEAEVGLLWDPDGDAGPFPMGGDLLTPGNAYEAWTLSYSAGGSTRVLVNASPYGESDLRFEWDPPVAAGTFTSLHGAAHDGEVTVDAWVAAAADGGVLYALLAVTAGAPIDAVAVGRAADLDPDADTTGDYSTSNTAGATGGGVGYAAGAGTYDGRAVALAVADGFGGLTAWSSAPDDIEGGLVGDADGDHQIGVATRRAGMAAGEVWRVAFVYAAAPTRDAAVAAGVEAAGVTDFDADGVIEGDCAPFDERVSPGQPERGDGIDNNCDGTIDEGSTASDDDGDGYSEAEGDCDEGDPAVHPGAEAVAGVTDADCDGVADAGWSPEVPPDQVEAAHIEGACATAAGGGRVPAGGGALAAALALVLARRRRP